MAIRVGSNGHTRTGGFTLMELLVVITIISMLLSIMLPSLNQAKEQARQLVCLSNVSQFGKIWFMYANDYNDQICSPETDLNEINPWDGGHVPGNRFNNWVADGPGVPFNDVCMTERALIDGALWPYVDEAVGLYKCPTDHRGLLRSYAISHAMGSPHEYNGERNYLSNTEIQNPSQRLVFIDARAGTPRRADGSIANLGSFYPIDTYRDEWLEGTALLSARHDGKCNMFFADLHCETWKWRDRQTIAYANGEIPFSVFQETSHENEDLPRLKKLVKGRSYRQE